MPSATPNHLDEPLSIGATHRLRFTRGALDPANPTLRDVFAAGGEKEPRRTVVVVDEGVKTGRPRLDADLQAYFEAHRDVMRLVAPPVVVPGGEAAKNSLDVFQRTVALTHQHGLCRRSMVLAIGGGAVLDAVGFGAATAHRGVRLVRMPTTTLAQDDAGVGVKNGVNLFGKKNFLGSFAVPWAVVNDSVFLETLSDRDFLAGFSECVKVALVKDGTFFDALERDAERIRRRDMAAAEPAIVRSAILHLEHIVRGGDPFELREARPLDFGHWSAHRLESMSGFEVRHGEAVAIGVMLDSIYSNVIGWLDERSAQRIARCLRRMGLALYHPILDDVEALLAGLEEFREHLGGRLTISLLRSIGRAEDVHHIDHEAMKKALEMLRNAAGSE